MDTFVRRTEKYLAKRVTHCCVLCGAELLRDRKILRLHIARHGLKNLGEYKKQIMGHRQRERMGAQTTSHRSLLKKPSTLTEKLHELGLIVSQNDRPVTSTTGDAQEDLSRAESNKEDGIAPDSGRKQALPSPSNSVSNATVHLVDDAQGSEMSQMTSESEKTPRIASFKKLLPGDLAPPVKRIKTIPRSVRAKSTSPSRPQSERSSATNAKLNTKETEATTPSGNTGIITGNSSSRWYACT